jgi:hypothetical protein
MKIKFFISKCEDCLIVVHNGFQYPIDLDDDVLGQCFALSKHFYNGEANYMADTRYKLGRLVLSVGFPDKIPSRSGLGL